MTLCAAVTAVAPATGTPTGTVAFSGPGSLSQAVPLNGSGEACLSTAALTVGLATATYSGDSGWN